MKEGVIGCACICNWLQAVMRPKQLLQIRFLEDGHASLLMTERCCACKPTIFVCLKMLCMMSSRNSWQKRHGLVFGRSTYQRVTTLQRKGALCQSNRRLDHAANARCARFKTCKVMGAFPEHGGESGNVQQMLGLEICPPLHELGMRKPCDREPAPARKRLPIYSTACTWKHKKHDIL